MSLAWNAKVIAMYKGLSSSGTGRQASASLIWNAEVNAIHMRFGVPGSVHNGRLQRLWLECESNRAMYNGFSVSGPVQRGMWTLPAIVASTQTRCCILLRLVDTRALMQGWWSIVERMLCTCASGGM